MPYYMGEEGKVFVTDEHVDVAIKIKLELQSLSPSRRCSWKKHKEMMMEEGFYDSSSTEEYRMMIVNEQRKRNKVDLMSLEDISDEDLKTENKLDSIKRVVGEMGYEKRENQSILREANKIKRALIDFGVAVEAVERAVENHDFHSSIEEFLNSKETKKIKTENSFEEENELVVCLSDIHIGALVNTKSNQYSYQVAIERMSKYLDKIMEYVELYDIDRVNIVGLGDMIEHATMRYGQGFDAEFNFSEQIVKSADLIIKMITFLLSKDVNVSYSGIAGNHDRITDKDKNLDNDHAVKLINKIIEVALSMIPNERAEYIQAEDYKHSIELNGLSILFLHGDLDSKKDDGIIDRATSIILLINFTAWSLSKFLSLSVILS